MATVPYKDVLNTLGLHGFILYDSRGWSDPNRATIFDIIYGIEPFLKEVAAPLGDDSAHNSTAVWYGYKVAKDKSGGSVGGVPTDAMDDCAELVHPRLLGSPADLHKLITEEATKSA